MTGFEYFIVCTTISLIVFAIAAFISGYKHGPSYGQSSTDDFMRHYRQEVRLEHERVRAEDMWRGKRD